MAADGTVGTDTGPATPMSLEGKKLAAEIRKLELESAKVELDNELTRMKLSGKERPSWWEILRTAFTWLA